MCACAIGKDYGGQSPPPLETPKEAVTGAEQPATPDESAQPDSTGGSVVVSFNYEKQSGSASNQFAVWIENIDGQFIKTLYATGFTAKGGYKNRPDSLVLWVEKSGLASMSKAEVDAVSAATPKAGTLSYTWDLTDIDGVIVPNGEYRFFVEGTLRWKNFVLYSGVIKVGDSPATAFADAEYIYEDSERYAALTDAAVENNMIGPVTAEFIPD